MTPGVAGRSATRHVALCSPRGCTNVVFHRCSAYPSARCVLTRGNILFALPALFTDFATIDPARITVATPAAAAERRPADSGALSAHAGVFQDRIGEWSQDASRPG